MVHEVIKVDWSDGWPPCSRHFLHARQISYRFNKAIFFYIVAPFLLSATLEAFVATHPLSVEDWWALKRVAAPSLSPDGKWAVVEVTRPNLKENKTLSDLWLLATDGSAQRPATPWAGSCLVHNTIAVEIVLRSRSLGARDDGRAVRNRLPRWMWISSSPSDLSRAGASSVLSPPSVT